MEKMMAYFVADLDLGETEGIYKKVSAEAAAIGKVLGSCDLVMRSGKNTKIVADNGNVKVEQQSLLDYALEQIRNGKVNFLYIRHMLPRPKLITMLRKARQAGIRVYYEIPTYPFFAEQFKISRQKYRALAKITLNVIFWPMIYRYIDRLVVIRSNTKARHYSKMIEITNGVRVDDIHGKSYQKHEPEVFRMVTVGTLYPYHGCDRVLKGMAACNERIGDTRIEFHVIGRSQTIDDLQQMAVKLGLKNVVFHGIKNTEELNEMFEQFDVGLGCLALHRRNADIDTALKVVEYFCRGVPVVSSGKCPLEDTRFAHIIQDGDDAVDISDIYRFYCSLSEESLQSLAEIAKDQLSWERIMAGCLG